MEREPFRFGTTITHKRLLEVLTYDPTTGEFTANINRGPLKAGQKLGNPHKDGYVRLMIDRKEYLGHRLAWLYMTGEWPNGELDHKNRIRSDNRWENLRLATGHGNWQNIVLPKSNTSGAKGICYDKSHGRWKVQIGHNGQRISLGYYSDLEDAKQVRAEAAYRLYGEFVNPLSP